MTACGRPGPTTRHGGSRTRHSHTPALPPHGAHGRTASTGVQDVVVNPAHHRQGVGRSLVEHLVRRYSHCRFFLLSTDHESSPEGKRNHAFYRSLGFLSYEEKEMAGFGLPRNRLDLRNAAP
ncbi:GNAT family N-acetyltransferase [Streptomyces sp. NPDC014870]|uniref:GNAT family N-acetyltransferase n=1 Tax=Streptomyces sp. NPDC014870 TaxID=3364925 RepID=UPI0036F5E269